MHKYKVGQKFQIAHGGPDDDFYTIVSLVVRNLTDPAYSIRWNHGDQYEVAESQIDSDFPVDSPTTTQVGGDHYRKCKIQPISYIVGNGLNFCEGNVVKYVTRWRDKGGLEDLKKARHYIDLLIEQESK